MRGNAHLAQQPEGITQAVTLTESSHDVLVNNRSCVNILLNIRDNHLPADGLLHLGLGLETSRTSFKFSLQAY